MSLTPSQSVEDARIMVALDGRMFAVALDSDLTLDREEALWIRRAKEADESAFRWLMDRYRRRAVRLAAHVLRRPDEAEDVAQEAFIRAFKHLHRFRGEGGFYSWLYRIVIRICLDRKRSCSWSAESSGLDYLTEPSMN